MAQWIKAGECAELALALRRTFRRRFRPAMSVGGGRPDRIPADAGRERRLHQDLPLQRLRGEALVRARHAHAQVRVLRHRERDPRERRARRGARLRDVPEGARGQGGDDRGRARALRQVRRRAERWAPTSSPRSAPSAARPSSRRATPTAASSPSRSCRSRSTSARAQDEFRRWVRKLWLAPNDLKRYAAERRGPDRHVPPVLDLRLPHLDRLHGRARRRLLHGRGLRDTRTRRARRSATARAQADALDARLGPRRSSSTTTCW